MTDLAPGDDNAYHYVGAFGQDGGIVMYLQW